MTYNCIFILLAWYYGVWHACHLSWQREQIDSGKWVPRNGDVPSAHAASWPCSCRIQSWAYGLGWQNGPLSMYPFTGNPCTSFNPKNHPRPTGVVEVVLDSLWDPWSFGDLVFFNKTRGVVFKYLPSASPGSCVNKDLFTKPLEIRTGFQQLYCLLCQCFGRNVVNDCWLRSSFLTAWALASQFLPSQVALHKTGCFTTEVTPDKRKGKILLYTSEEACPSRVFFGHSLCWNRW